MLQRGPGVTPANWLSSSDARELLGFAAPRIPREHLSLVLAEMAESTVYYWSVRYPLDWRLAWGVATLRAWCFGHASTEELKRARDLVLEAHRLPFSDSHVDQGARAAATCVVGCTTVPLQRAANSIAQPVDLGFVGLPDLVADAAHHASLAVQHGFDGEASSYAASQVRLADLIRRLIPFPALANRQWVGSPGIAFAGEVILRIDGRKIGDVVRREEFNQLSGARAVAFDAAQQDAEPESPLQFSHREQVRLLAEAPVAPTARRTGCVMSPIMIDGVQVGTRISCYGHPELQTAPAASVKIKKDDEPRQPPRSIAPPLPEASATRRETRARASATAPRPEPARPAVTTPDTKWAPGSRWLTGILFTALAAMVFGPVQHGAISGESAIRAGVLALSMAAGLWWLIELAVEPKGKEEQEWLTLILAAFGLPAVLGSVVASVMGAGVRLGLDTIQYDSANGIARETASLLRAPQQVKFHRGQEAQALLRKREKRLAGLRPLPVTAEAALATFVLSPLLLLMAFTVAYRVTHTEAWHAPLSTSSTRALWAAGFERRQATRPTQQ